MNATKIDWCDVTWNPVTGCLHNCPYCYARRIAERFGGYTSAGEKITFCPQNGKIAELHEHPLLLRDGGGKVKKAPFPFGFKPTFHRYRLDEPQHAKKPQTVFVCSMADLFGEWVPLRWVRDVLDACAAAPQHRYLFLTKNPKRYADLMNIALLPWNENHVEDSFWYGISVTTQAAKEQAVDVHRKLLSGEWDVNLFWSVEPMLEPIYLKYIPWDLPPAWVIIGAETGNRKGKVVPKREWVKHLADECAEIGIPIFYKDSIRKLFPDLPESRFPWKPEAKGAQS